MKNGQTRGVEITLFVKANGPLTKRIGLLPDGAVCSDGSCCLMAHGAAQRVNVGSLREFAELIGGMRSDQAISLGQMRPGLMDKVEVTTKAKLNGVAQPHIMARTADNIVYRKGRRALALFDFDRKGMPAEVSAELD